MPRVSILTPAYNCEKYIVETIESALKQTFQDFEMIIVDDGSIDRTQEIVERYVFNFPEKIRYIYQANGGPAKARNRGIRESKGEYLALLDADDLWLPNRLEETVAVLNRKAEVGLVHAKTKRILEDGRFTETPRKNIRYLSGHIFPYILLRKANISCLTVLFRKECVEKVGYFDETKECFGVEDRDLWLRIASNYRIEFIDKVLGYYRLRSSGISQGEKIQANKIYVINKHCSSEQHKTLKKLALAQIYRELGDSLLAQKEIVQAKYYYWQSISFYPFKFWPWINLLRLSLRRY